MHDHEYSALENVEKAEERKGPSQIQPGNKMFVNGPLQPDGHPAAVCRLPPSGSISFFLNTRFPIPAFPTAPDTPCPRLFSLPEQPF